MANEFFGPPDATGHSLEEAIQRIPLPVHEGSLVTKWMVLVEYMNPEGQKMLYWVSPPSVTKWDRSGMMRECQKMDDMRAGYHGEV